MPACTTVPYPSDDADAMARGAAVIRAQAGALHGQVTLAGRIGQTVSATWVGDAADAFTAHHAAVLAHGYGVAASHARMADAIDRYRQGVESCQDTSRRAQARIEETTADHNRKVAWHVDTMRQRVAELTRQAQDDADQAWNALQNGNLFTAVGDLFQAGQDALQAATDQLALLGQASAALDNWTPVALASDRDLVPAGHPVPAWPADAVTANLQAAGGFLFTAITGGIGMFLALADDTITTAVNGIQNAEHDVAAGIASIQRDVSDAFTTLDQVGTSVGRDLENITYSAGRTLEVVGTTVFHAAVTGMENTAQAFGKAVDIVGQDAVDGVDAVGTWVRKNSALMSDISTVVGDVATVAGVLSLVPGIDIIAGPVLIAATATQAGVDLVRVASGVAEPSTLAWDAVGVLSLGGGMALGRAAKTAAEDARIATADKSAADAAAKATEREADAAAARGTEAEASTARDAANARGLADDAAQHADDLRNPPEIATKGFAGRVEKESRDYGLEGNQSFRSLVTGGTRSAYASGGRAGMLNLINAGQSGAASTVVTVHTFTDADPATHTAADNPQLFSDVADGRLAADMQGAF